MDDSTIPDADRRDRSPFADPPSDEAKRLAAEMARAKFRSRQPDSMAANAAALQAQYAHADTQTFLRAMVHEVFKDRIVVVSSFGAESAVLLDLVAKVDRSVPVIFLETGMHFAQTLQYRNTLIRQLGLTNVQSVSPNKADLDREDPDETLWQWDTDKCCHIRKVVPLDDALKGFDAWINGRKQIHGGTRVRLPRLEASGAFVKVNPLAWWSKEEIDSAFRDSALPPHPMVEQGYTSIGCWPCTQLANESGLRSGRWAGSDKTECGIHGPLLKTG